MKILVTGGAGFIGSHIVDKYINLGHRVVIIDDLSTGKKQNINKRAKFYKLDIRNATLVEKVFVKEKPQVVNHHAAIAEVVKSIKNPLPTLEVNVLGIVNILRASGLVKIKKFIFSSTGGAIYGQPKKIPADEFTSPIALSAYGLSKFLGEECIKFYSRLYGFDYLIFRYPNVYGPRQDPKGEAGVVAIFSGLLRTNKRPTIYGDGTKARDYVHIDDIVRANVIALKKGEDEILNLGWGKPISDQIIFDEVVKSFRAKIKPIYAPFREGEVYQIALKADLAKKKIGWKPQVSLKEGIRRTVLSFLK